MAVILGIGTSKVEAVFVDVQDKYIKENNTIVNMGKLRLKDTMKIKANGYTTYVKNLFCVERTDHLKNKWNTYTIRWHVKIQDSYATIKANKNDWCGIDTSTGFKEDYNKKLALGIASLKSEKNNREVQKFIWGYFKTWNDHVGVDAPLNNPIPKTFCTKAKTSGLGDIINGLDDEIEDMEKSVNNFQDSTSYADVNLKEIEINGKKYHRMGPCKITGRPSEGLKSVEVKDQKNNKNITDAYVIKYKDTNNFDKIKVGSNNDFKTVIKNNQNFYICIPTNVSTAKISVTMQAQKQKSESVSAEMYLLTSGNGEDAWQNLIVAEGTTTTKKESPKVTINLGVENGNLKIKKYDSINNSPLPGAGFIFFRYVQDDKGTWKQDDIWGRGYEQIGENEQYTGTRYKREYVYYDNGYKYNKKTSKDKVQNDPKYVFETNANGIIQLNGLKVGTYYAEEVKVPTGYDKAMWARWNGDNFVKGQCNWFPIGEVKPDGETERNIPNSPTTTNLRLEKVNEDDHNVKIAGVKFRLYHSKYGWLKEISKNNYEYKTNENEATWFTTDSNGIIYLEGLPVGDWTYREDPNSLPYGYDITGKETGTFKLENIETNTILITNKQRWIKLSGYVWVDKVGKKDSDGNNRNDVFDKDGSDLLLDGIKVRLKDKDGHFLAASTLTGAGSTSYTEAYDFKHGVYAFKDVEIDKLDGAYIEFEYDGITYTNVATNINIDNGSKAAEGDARRNNFDKRIYCY